MENIMELVTVDDWTLRVDGEEPLIQDLELGRRLGFAEPVDVRKLIRRNINDLGSIATVAKNSSDPLGRGRPATEYWLNREQALFVTTKSKTANAIAMTKEIIRVFLAVADGATPQPGVAAVPLDIIDELQRLAGHKSAGTQTAAVLDKFLPKHLRPLRERAVRTVALSEYTADTVHRTELAVRRLEEQQKASSVVAGADKVASALEDALATFRSSLKS